MEYFKIMSTVLCGLFLGLNTAVQAQEQDSTSFADTSVLTVSARNSVIGNMVQPGLLIPEEDIAGYSREKISGIMQEHYGTMPLTGSLHAFLGRRDIDWLNLYRYQSAYVAAGVQLAPWLEVNGGGTFGVSMLKDRKPVPVAGGMMSVIMRPSENTSMMLWGSYTDFNAFGTPTFNPVSAPRINIGASAKFKIGDATIGVGASFSTTP